MIALMPHGNCFLWDRPLTGLHVIGDVGIAVAYFSIPVLLFINRRYASANARPLLLLFAAFILSCGIGHVIEVWNIWHANYWLAGLEKLITASISILTAVELYARIPNLLGTEKALVETERLVHRDPLTGLANRRALEPAIASAIQSANDPKQVQALLLLDLDNFKLVNDTYGHPIGDDLLRRVGEVLLLNTRSVDVVARLGGDEFAILLTDCSTIAALHVAEKLRAAIEAIDFYPAQQAERYPIGVSIGVASVLPQATPAQIYLSADTALYQAKHAGKNQIAVSHSS